MNEVNLEVVRRLEEHLFNAWPALETIHHEGFLLRFARGHTKRSNAASAFYPTQVDLDDLIDYVFWTYRGANIKPIFRLTPLSPAGLDQRLEEAGWQHFETSLVLCRDLDQPVSVEGLPDASVILEDNVSDLWVEGAADAYGLAEWQRDVLGEIVSRIRLPKAFTTVIVNRQRVGFGLAVADRGYVGLYDLAITEHMRGRGVGHRMITTMLHWGRSRGAHTAYLQMREANVRAHKLYTRLGFEEAYRYHHRIKD